jgi:LVIVD repeat
VAGNYHGGSHAAGTSGSADHDPKSNEAWLSIYDVSDCANPRLTAEVAWPQNSHTVRLSPDATLVYGTAMSPFTGEGGLQVMDISDLAHPRFLGKFGATRPDGSTFEFASHEVSFSPDGTRVYAGVNASKGGDLNAGLALFPPSARSLGNDGGGVYILDNTDLLKRRPDPRLRLRGVMPGGGWHSVLPARIGGRAYLVGGAELGGCPGTWPRITDIADEARPVLAGEFRLAMNHTENCPGGKAAAGPSGIVPVPGTATLHYNAVDSATDTRLGLFNFMWGGLRVADLGNPAKPQEVAYFKPGDVCTGHVRYLPKSGQIWLVCNASGFHVLELSGDVKRALRKPVR